LELFVFHEAPLIQKATIEIFTREPLCCRAKISIVAFFVVFLKLAKLPNRGTGTSRLAG
jgi:hypothetical protein